MIRKEILFEDFDGGEASETHYFHISKSEFVELNLTTDGGIEAKFAKLVADKDAAGILKMFKDIIDLSYGRRDPENPRRFDKSPEILAAFKSSPAWDALYTELMANEGSAIEFITGVLPKSMSSDPKMVTAIAKAYSETDGQPAVVPDPNGLDSPTATWPRDPQSIVDVKLPDDSKAWSADNGPQPEDEHTYLASPRDEDGNLVPWAFREPNSVELSTMSKPQMMDAFRRKSTDWQPYQFKTR